MRDPQLKPIHPGEILREEILLPLNITPIQLAEKIGVEERIITQIVNEEHNITPEIALRLGIYFGQSPQFWLNCQRDYEQDCLSEIIEEKETILKTQLHPYHWEKNKPRSVMDSLQN